MKSRTHSRLHSPIALRVAALNRYILAKRGKAKKAVQYNYIDDLIKQCYLLFKYALRQLSGKDYVKRTIVTTHKTLYFFRRDGHIVCAQKRKYMPKYSAIQNIQKFKNEICGLQARSCHIRMRRRACRRVENNSNKQDYVLGKIGK